MTILPSVYYLLPNTPDVIQQLKNVGIKVGFGYNTYEPYVGINIKERTYYTYDGRDVNDIPIPHEFINIAITLAVSVDQSTYVQSLDSLLNTQHTTRI